MQQLDKIKFIRCIRCNRQPKKSIPSGGFITHICYCDNVFWTLQLCANNCDKPGKTVLHNKPKAGDLIQCKNCGASFHLFKCPKQQCWEYFYFNKGHYFMGEPINCKNCEIGFKVVVCPCGGVVFLQKNFKIIEGFTSIHCKQCQKSFVYTICSECTGPNYFPQKLEMGDQIKCGQCKKKHVYVPCPRCNRTTNAYKFSYCLPNVCNYCQIQFQFSQCPYGCGVNYFIGKDMMGPIKVCNGNYCQGNKYFVINCKKCTTPVYIEQFEQGIAQKQYCPTCKFILEYYICVCGKVNINQLFCSNQTCPPPKKIITSIVQKKQQVVPNNQNYDEDQCKLCFMNKSQMINTSCWHIMMCQQCYKQYKRKSIGTQDRRPCPICKIVGHFAKFKKPHFC